MNDITLGRLERVDLRTVWAGEASAFTPWLAQTENISVLGDALDLELEVVAQEQPLGPFRADILCKDTATDQWVLIENQLERTDHTHLGQLLIYAAGLEAVTIVWVAARFTDEHRAALDWLNNITASTINFFGLEIELWRIGVSPIAPKFNLVSKPNEWNKRIRQSVSDGSPSTPAEQFHLEFWGQFRGFMQRRNTTIRIQKPLPQYWTNVALGRTGATLQLSNGARDGWSAVELVLNGADAGARLEALRREHGQQLEELAHRAKAELQWLDGPERKTKIARFKRASHPATRETWPELNAWLADMTEQLHRFLSPIVKAPFNPPAAELASPYLLGEAPMASP